MLENKFGIRDEVLLLRAEELSAKRRALELFDSGKLNEFEVGSFAGLCAIHKYLFDEVYDFAGKIRDVNLAKDDFSFAPAMFLKSSLDNIDSMPQDNFDQIIEKYVEMNIAHPFREGNGRSLRIWLDLILKNVIGKVVDWSKIAKDDYFLAIKRSLIDDAILKSLLKSALTDDINSRDIFIRGIDQSFYYEGFCYYNAKDIR